MIHSCDRCHGRSEVRWYTFEAYGEPYVSWNAEILLCKGCADILSEHGTLEEVRGQ